MRTAEECIAEATGLEQLQERTASRFLTPTYGALALRWRALAVEVRRYRAAETQSTVPPKIRTVP